MVLLSGPRQCGKTTFARGLYTPSEVHYLNWDRPADRKSIQASALDEQKDVWILDELHKFRRWRNWLKGLYDGFGHTSVPRRHKILVTGSARLELYSRGGDSLQGRYFGHRLHPLTLSEATGSVVPPWAELPKNILPLKKETQNILEDLQRLGGFPEPFLSGSDRHASRWRLGYGTRLIQEDVRDLEQVQDLARLELLYDRLPDTVGSVLSVNSLREDLEVAHVTLGKWITILERLYAVFRISPFGPAKIKAVKKEPKLFFWDWARVSDEGHRFENLVAVHLLRLAHWIEDTEGKKAELRYFRTVPGHEVDFVFLLEGKPWMAIEVKLDDRPLDSNLKYFLERVKVPHAFQISLNGNRNFSVPAINGCQIRILPASQFLAGIP
ncbi:ATP-binding protein [Bdellovibrionota bacterium FG-1]